jgi:hypothetical protein
MELVITLDRGLTIPLDQQLAEAVAPVSTGATAQAQPKITAISCFGKVPRNIACDCYPKLRAISE